MCLLLDPCLVAAHPHCVLTKDARPLVAVPEQDGRPAAAVRGADRATNAGAV